MTKEINQLTLYIPKIGEKALLLHHCRIPGCRQRSATNTSHLTVYHCGTQDTGVTETRLARRGHFWGLLSYGSSYQKYYCQGALCTTPWHGSTTAQNLTRIHMVLTWFATLCLMSAPLLILWEILPYGSL